MLNLIDYIEILNAINETNVGETEQFNTGHTNKCIAKEDDWELFIGSHAKERLYRHVEMGGMTDKINQNTLIKLFKRNANEIVRNCGTDKTVGNRHNLNTKTASFIIIDRKRNPNLNVICTYLSYKNGVYKFVINTVISKNAFKVKNENEHKYINECRINDDLILNIYEE